VGEIDTEDAVCEYAARLAPQQLKPITSAVMAVVNTFCGREKQDLDPVLYAGIVSSPNAWGWLRRFSGATAVQRFIAIVFARFGQDHAMPAWL
jgi:hypothetical protein